MPLSNSGRYDDVSGDGYVSTALTVTTTAAEAKVGSIALPGRQELLLYNDSAGDVYVGPASVTATGSTKGITLHAKEFLVLPVGPTISVYLITAAGTKSVIIQELA